MRSEAKLDNRESSGGFNKGLATVLAYTIVYYLSYVPHSHFSSWVMAMETPSSRRLPFASTSSSPLKQALYPSDLALD